MSKTRLRSISLSCLLEKVSDPLGLLPESKPLLDLRLRFLLDRDHLRLGEVCGRENWRTRFRFSFYARRLYSGDTSDEENFIGYGFAFSLVDISPNGGAVPGGLSSEIKLYSYVNEQPESFDIKRDYATFSLSGAPFILSLIHISEPTRPY